MEKKAEFPFPRPGNEGIIDEMSFVGYMRTKRRRAERLARTKWVDYQPGNGTRYDVVMNFLPSREDAQFIVTVANFRSSMEVALPLSSTSIGYMMEKLELKEADCVALRPLINDFIEECAR